MNYVYLSPHFPPNYQQFCYRLEELGVNVLGIADTPFHELGERLRATLREYYRVGTMHDYEELLRAVAFLTFRYGRVDRIESHNEYWLETEAALRTDFNVPGVKNDSIQWVKRKSRMKELFRQAGIKVADGRVVDSLADARKLVSKLKYPVVLKPDTGVGAAGACKINDKHELEAFFAHKPPLDFIMEECLEGLLCSFDGLVDAANEIVFCTGHVFKQGIMETVSDDDDMWYYSLRELPADLEAAGRAAVKAFGIRERFFHIEFFRSHRSGEIVAMELNMRPPGGLTMEMFNFANDFDLYREYANVVARGRFEAQWSRPYHCMYIGRKQSKTYCHSHDDIMRVGTGLLVYHERTQSIFARAIGDYAYLARCSELEPLQTLARYALEVS